MKKKKKDGFSLKKRIQYWFDNRIANGSLGLIRALIAASLVMAVLIAGLILLFGFEEDSEPAAVIWDSIATVINAWMPYWDEGSLGYLLLMSVTAIAGVLFTSVLIGIVTIGLLTLFLFDMAVVLDFNRKLQAAAKEAATDLVSMVKEASKTMDLPNGVSAILDEISSHALLCSFFASASKSKAE